MVEARGSFHDTENRKTFFKHAVVEFALHPQHETSRDSETQTKEDFKSKSGKRLRSLLMVLWNNNDWYEY